VLDDITQRPQPGDAAMSYRRNFYGLVEVTIPPSDTRVFMTWRVWDHCRQIDQTELLPVDIDCVEPTTAEFYSLWAEADCVPGTIFPMSFSFAEYLVHVNRIPNESGDVWLLITRVELKPTRLRSARGEGGVQ
jgi:hypothetical protein